MLARERLTFQAGASDSLATFQLYLMGAFAQLERAIAKERQREGIDLARAKRLTADDVAQARLDLAEELGATLYLFTTAMDPAADESIRAEARDALRPFDKSGLLTLKGQAVLAWTVPHLYS